MSDIQYLSPKLVREICEVNSITPSKKFGQNFMVDSGQINKIVKAAEFQERDKVLEVGPGLGSLTLGLLASGAKVTAVEIDSKLADLLPKTIQRFAPSVADNLEVLNADALRLADDTLDSSDNIQLVANLPYNVGVPILLTLLEQFECITSAMVLVQAEVADRLVAPPGSKTYGIPSVKLAYFGEASTAGVIPRSAFYPVPRVDSKLVRWRRNPSQNAELSAAASELYPTFASVVDTAFAHRRKMLRSSFAADVLSSANINGKFRAEQLTFDDFLRLSEVIAQ